MFENILFICIGNICRSPMADIILRTDRPQLKVSSAGLGALVGKPAEPYTVEVLNGHGYSSTEHRARQVDKEMVQQADLVIALEPWHVEDLLSQFPEARGKVHLLGKWNDNESIKDPYKHPVEAFEKVYERISYNVALWIEKAEL